MIVTYIFYKCRNKKGESNFMDDKVAYQVKTTEMNTQNMKFIVTNRSPQNPKDINKVKIVKELFQIFKNYL